MKSNIKSYEEQVLELGNGKMLKPGCYDENMKRLCSIKCSIKKSKRFYDIREKIHYIIFDEDMEIIPRHFASSLMNLEQVILSDKTEKIEDCAFYKCSKLKKFVFPEGLTYIGHDAFKFTSLTSVYLPSSIHYLGLGVFAYCDKLTAFYMPKVNETIMGLIPGLTSLRVFDYMFFEDRSLEKVILPEGLENIGEKAFKNCLSLKTIIIPSTVANIYGNAFEGCPNLKLIKLSNKIEIISDNVFGMMPCEPDKIPIMEIDGRQMSIPDILDLGIIKKSNSIWRYRRK